MDLKRALWAMAVALLMLAPWALLWGATWWGVAIVVAYELGMVLWLARWVKGERR